VREKQAAWEEEQRARAEDEASGDLPLVGLRTSRGLVVVSIHARDVPVAAKHFLDLVDAKFYDGTLFHRVLGDFVAQGGDPVSRDQGCDFAGSGTSPTEVDMEIDERHGFWRGAVGFARKMRESNGSQFFFMTAPRPDLGDYTCFGHVVAGMEHVDRIEHCDVLHEAFVLRR
jgi:cyclophilin family peptidyl-prolyl cis-trans isomerase